MKDFVPVANVWQSRGMCVSFEAYDSITRGKSVRYENKSQMVCVGRMRQSIDHKIYMKHFRQINIQIHSYTQEFRGARHENILRYYEHIPPFIIV